MGEIEVMGHMHMEKEKSRTTIYVQHIKMVIEEELHPPRIWIEVYKVLKGKYIVITSLDIDEDLEKALEETLKIVRKLINKRETEYACEKMVNMEG